MASQFFLKKSPDGPEVEIRVSMKVGRLEDNDIVLRDARYASRHHATLMLDGEKLYVEDAGSSNGTFVNGHRIGVKTALQNKDSLRFDTEEYVVRGPPVNGDAQKTIFRGPQSDKTQFRAPVAPKPEAPTPPTPAAVSPVAPAAPPVVAPVAPVAPAAAPKVVEVASRSPELPQGSARRPGAWIDPQQNSDPNATKFFTRDGNTPTQFEPSTQRIPTDVMVPTLLIVSGTRAGQRVELPTGGDKNEWIIGSDAGLDVTLPDDGISHVHAAIERSGDRWTVCNKLATNGVFVNGNPTARRLLASQDRIEFGPVKTQFLLPKTNLLMQAGRSPLGVLDRMGSKQVWLAIAAFVVTLGVIVLIKWIRG
jgi:pSer/pThr/pTyr-binding forkhead associated (FHA) protein